MAATGLIQPSKRLLGLKLITILSRGEKTCCCCFKCYTTQPTLQKFTLLLRICCHLTSSLMGFLLSVLWRDHSEWKVQTISCCTRCSRMSFQLSLLWRTDSDWKIRRTSCYIAAKWVFFWVYSDVLIQIEKLGIFLLHKEYLNKFSS